MCKINLKEYHMKRNLKDLTICSDFAKQMANLVGKEEIVEAFSQEPKEVMEYALSRACETLKTDFASQVGLWEGFTLGEHTESVMLFFKENFADTCPCDKITQAMMNLIIFCHDIGKVEEKNKEKYSPVSHQEKFDFYENNTILFLEDLGIKQNRVGVLAKLINYLTQNLERVTTNYYVAKNLDMLPLLEKHSLKVLEKCGLDDSQKMVDGLSVMARVLQTCDGGAYTIYGKTRDAKTDTYSPNLNWEWSLGFTLTKEGFRFKLDNTNDCEQTDDMELKNI